MERSGLPHGTPKFVMNDPLLWPQHHRFTKTKIALDLFYLTGCAPLLFRAFAKQPRTRVLASCRTLLRALASLYTFHVVFSMATASLSLWIASHAATTSEGIYQAYIHAYSIIDFILCLVHVGIVFLVAEADPLFWRGPRDPKRIRWWCALFRLWSYAAGWHMAFCLSTIRLSVALTTQLDALGYVAVNTGLTPEQDIVIEDMLKIMFFFSGFLLLIPFWFVGSPWTWGSMALHASGAACRFAIVAGNGRPDEMTPHWVSLLIDTFFLRIPTLLVLNMFAGLLYIPRRR